MSPRKLYTTGVGTTAKNGETCGSCGLRITDINQHIKYCTAARFQPRTAWHELHRSIEIPASDFNFPDSNQPELREEIDDACRQATIELGFLNNNGFRWVVESLKKIDRAAKRAGI